MTVTPIHGFHAFPTRVPPQGLSPAGDLPLQEPPLPANNASEVLSAVREQDMTIDTFLNDGNNNFVCNTNPKRRSQ